MLSPLSHTSQGCSFIFKKHFPPSHIRHGKPSLKAHCSTLSGFTTTPPPPKEFGEENVRSGLPKARVAAYATLCGSSRPPEAHGEPPAETPKVKRSCLRPVLWNDHHIGRHSPWQCVSGTSRERPLTEPARLKGLYQAPHPFTRWGNWGPKKWKYLLEVR